MHPALSRFAVHLLVCAGLGLAVGRPATAAQIYLCKAYSGGQFWSNAPCSSQRATLVRMVDVPDGMPFEQQVQLGQQTHAEREALRQPPAAAPFMQYRQPAPTAPVPNPAAQCQALDAQVRALDDQARQPQTAQMQDRIRAARHQARAQQFQLGCRGG